MAFDQENHLANREETMSDCTATQEQQATFVQAMSERMTQLDQQLGFCAGGQSAGLSEILALMGALCPFEEAVQLIQKLSLVSVSANSSKAATEQLGETISQAEQQALDTAWSSSKPTLPPAPT